MQNMSIIESMAETTEVCSKCKTNPRGYPGTSNPWCKKCLATYKGEYDEALLIRERSKGFVAGVEAMAQMLYIEFGRHGRAQVTCAEVATTIQMGPRPQYRAEFLALNVPVSLAARIPEE